MNSFYVVCTAIAITNILGVLVCIVETLFDRIIDDQRRT